MPGTLTSTTAVARLLNVTYQLTSDALGTANAQFYGAQCPVYHTKKPKCGIRDFAWPEDFSKRL